jgi:hypothetical protein
MNIISAVSALEHDLESNIDLGLQIDAELRDARAQHEEDLATIQRLRAELAASQASNVILANENRNLRTAVNSPRTTVATNGLKPAVTVYHHAADSLGMTFTIVRSDGSRFGVGAKRIDGVIAKLKSRYGSVECVDGEPPPMRERRREPPSGDYPHYAGNFTGD